MPAFVTWFVFAVLVVNVFATEEKLTIIRDVCITSKCRNVTVEECQRQGKYWLPRNANACCSRCTECDPTFCSRARCMNVAATCKWNEKYVPGDGLCDCCGTCQRVTCDPARCATVRCAGDRLEDCKENEILVNPRGICDCCGGVCKKDPDCAEDVISI